MTKTDTIEALRKQYGRWKKPAQSLEVFFDTIFMTLDTLRPEDQKRILDLVHRVRELRNERARLVIKLPGQGGFGDLIYQHIRELIAKADRLANRRSLPYPPPLPAPHGPDLFTALPVLVRNLEREVTQWKDVHRSPDALRWFAEQWEEPLREEKKRRQEQAQEQAQERRRWAQEQVRRLIEEFGLSPFADGLNSANDALKMFGLPPTGGPEAIKARYGVLMRRLHPDTNAGGTNALMEQVLEAMRMLRAAGRA